MPSIIPVTSRRRRCTWLQRRAQRAEYPPVASPVPYLWFSRPSQHPDRMTSPTVGWPAAARRRATRADWLPGLARWMTAAVAALNLGSVLTPDLRARAHALRHLVPHELPVAAHALALAAGVTLLLLAWYLGRRRRRAWALTLGVLIVAGALNLAKGLDLEEAAANWALAALLWWGRDAFWVRPGPEDAAGVARRLALVASAWVLAPLAAILAAAHHVTPHLTLSRVVREEAHLLMLSPGPLRFHHPFGWVPTGVGVLSVWALAIGAALIFRPRSLRRTPAGPDARRAARRLVVNHGSDTLAGFKLRRDNQLFFSSDHRAFCAYTVESGVLLVSGDPIGEPSAIPGLVRELAAFAEGRGLRLTVLGARGACDGVWSPLRMRSLYIGDEAIVETAGFSLEGRRIRKIRQSVTRLVKHGYSAEADRKSTRLNSSHVAI